MSIAFERKDLNVPLVNAEKAGSVFSPIVGRPITLSRERLEGMMLGVGIGDALGLPVETWTADEIAAQFGVLRSYEDTNLNDWYKGKDRGSAIWSDDAQLTAALFTAFADAGGYSLDSIVRCHIEAFDRSTDGWGGSTLEGVKALKDGLDPEGSAFSTRLRSGTGNGIPMKVSAVAAHLAKTGGGDQDMLTIVRGICSLSHRTSISVSAGLAHVAAVLYCLSCSPDEFSKDEFVRNVARASLLGETAFPETRGADEITERLFRSGDFQNKTAHEIIKAFGGGSCYVYDSLPFSYAFFLRDPFRFAAVEDAINAGGDTDSNGAFVACLQGALLGTTFFPRGLLDSLQNKEELLSSTEKFVRRYGIE